MPLDVPSYSFALPEGVDPPTLVSFLAERFDIVAEPGRPSPTPWSTPPTAACGPPGWT